MADQDLKAIFAQAAEIAKTAPKELREAAFNRALDALLGSTTRAGTGGTSRRRERVPDALSRAAHEDPTADLLRDLNRTAHPEISRAPRVLERALLVLRAARDSHKIDGLSAPQIARVLTEKFRLRATRQAVTQALDAAGDKVDRVVASGNTLYRIMHPGDEYLEAGVFPDPRSSARPATKRRRDKAPVPGKATKRNAADKKAERSSTRPKGSRTRSGRPGPLAMIRQLVESGLFATGRTIADIQSHCRQNLAYMYRASELSPSLGRAVRNSLLKREQNADGQYQYIAG